MKRKAIDGKRCGECDFFMDPDLSAVYGHHYTEEDGGGLGRCHRFPPTVKENQTWMPPIVYAANWCGEWKRRPR